MRTTEAERVRYVEVFRRSGLTPVEFCSELWVKCKNLLYLAETVLEQ